ncbi:Nicotinamidase-related amidase [Cohaesibacter sp. ES.047]|uniref:isochorismatase family protein n=1 Tax=Cohaesibacter sp. ES.047 TaxID=1798205 RepID=UPI000BB6A67D|nr:isochorismatase family protein [Cohaesibacter sp. ES.047]SNY92643.1 Nicotinamidase-related amidase [Cohaesibacter sp. ES.047]
MSDTQSALVVIDIQNDYFDGFAFPLWQAETVLEKTLEAVEKARKIGLPVVLVRHVADPANGPAPFFNDGTAGVAIRPELLAACPDAPVVTKRHADSFYQTDLSERLAEIGATKILIAGMMTQNCVTHTAISRQADIYNVTVLEDLSTSVSEMVHKIALNALGPLVTVCSSTDVL